MKKTNKMLISIGIPAYNEEANIGYLINSLILQKEKNYKINEIIVVSDGSTDNTVSEVRKIKDKRIVLIEDKHRHGQNKRLNQITSLFSGDSLALLILEADTHVDNSLFIANLVDYVPSDSNYSFVSATTKMLPSKSNFGRIMDFGFELRKKIFNQSKESISLYQMSSVKLLSKQFLKEFKWIDDLHEDSYLFREAQKSNLPILISKLAIVFYKSTENLKDYLTQSSKFQKAMIKENRHSGIYKPKLIWINVILILFKEALRNPIYFISYFFFAITARIYSKFTSEYTVLWKQYSSTKNLFREKELSPVNI